MIRDFLLADYAASSWLDYFLMSDESQRAVHLVSRFTTDYLADPKGKIVSEGMMRRDLNYPENLVDFLWPELDSQGSSVPSPLLIASVLGMPRLVQYMIEKGADVNEHGLSLWCRAPLGDNPRRTKHQEGSTPTHLSSHSPPHNSTMSSYSSLPEFESRDNSFEWSLSSLYAASKMRCHAVAKGLIDNGARVNDVFDGDRTALSAACEGKSYEVLNLPLEAGAASMDHPFACTKPLYIASLHHDRTMMERLISEDIRADPNHYLFLELPKEARV